MEELNSPEEKSNSTPTSFMIRDILPDDRELVQPIPRGSEDLLRLLTAEDELVRITTTELNRLCRDNGVSDAVAKKLKKKRRALKNRDYAYSSRIRRVSQKKQLEEERDTLKQQLTQIQEKLKLLQKTVLDVCKEGLD